MTISTATSRVTYLGDGVTTTFPVPFRFDAATDLRVALVSPAGTTVALTLDAGFTATGAGAPTGGAVTLAAVPVTGDDIVIRRVVARAQTIVYTRFGPFPAVTTEAALDRLTMMAQEDADALGRTVMVPDADPAGPALTLPPAAQRANTLAAYDASGAPVVGPTTAQVDVLIAGAFSPTAQQLADNVLWSRPGGVVRTMTDKSRDRCDLRDFPIRRREDTSNEYTAEINAALLQAKSENLGAVFCEESYTVAGSVVMPSGLALVSAGGSTAWYDPANYPQRYPAGFYKPPTGLDGPLIIRGIADTLIGITLDHQKYGGAKPLQGGVMQMGPIVLTNNCNNTTTMRCTVLGHEINYDPGGTRLRRMGPMYPTYAALVVFPPAPVGTQRYQNTFTGLRLSNAWIGIYFGNQANANVFDGVQTSQIWRMVDMDGTGGEVLGNSVNGKWINSYPLPTTTQTAEQVGALSPTDLAISQQDIVFLSTIGQVQSNRLGGYLENGGRMLSVDPATLPFYNDISAIIPNTSYPTDIPENWAAPLSYYNPNRRRGDLDVFVPYPATYAPTVDTRTFQGFGNRVNKWHVLTDNLPLLNGGAISTAASSKVFARWTVPGAVSKGVAPTIVGKLRIIVEAAGGGAGVHITETEFSYRVANKTGAVGSFSIRRPPIQEPPTGNYVTALSFLTGTAGTAGRAFGFAVTCGNGGAVAAELISASIDADVSTSNGNVVNMADLSPMNWAMVPVTADDVTDAVSMLTVAVTTV